jgi:signal transduction histidine kinase
VSGGAAPRLPRPIPSDLPAPTTSSFVRRIAGERAEERVYRALAFAFLPGGVLFGLLAMPGAFEQHALWPLWWTITAMVIGILPSIAMGIGAFLVPVGVLRGIARLNIVGTLVVLASIPFVVMPVHTLTMPIWFADVSGLGIISAALAAKPWAAVLAALGGAVLTAVDRASLDGPSGFGTGTQTGLYLLLLTLTFIALGVSSLAAARAADSAEAAAEEATAGAAADAARERERSRINELVHDRVLATLLTAAREIPGSGGLERRDAQRALEGLQALLNDDLVPADLSGEDFLWKVQATTTALLPEALFNYEVDDDAGVLPGDVADALVDAAEEAMRNSRKHAQAANRTVHVRVGRSSADIDVLDDGVGFERVSVPPGRLGLNDSIEGRMRALPGGSALVVSQPGVGTRVSVRWSAP